MRRTLVLSLTLLLLWTLMVQANHLLSNLRVYLFVGGLYVAYSALLQPFRHGFIASLVGGLFCDVNAPAAVFGTHAILFAAAHVCVFHVRDRVPRNDTSLLVVVALLANLALFLLFSFTRIHLSPAPAAVWLRLLADLVCSQIFLTLIAPWFFALQSRALALARVDRELYT